MLHAFGTYFYVDEDFEVGTPLPLTVTFESNFTRVPIPINLIDDNIEEGYENFTLQVSYNEIEETVLIMTVSANVFIKDDDGMKLVRV